MSKETLADAPDSKRCYVPGIGEVTLGQVRATAKSELDRRLEDEEAREDLTLRMWGWIVTHPDDKVWKNKASAFWRALGGWERWHEI